jgi:cystathionine beta-synthase
MARRITREEGILSGGSCGTAMVAAREVVRELAATDGGHEAVVVVLLPDSGRSYLSKIYNDEWMRANGLLATTGPRRRIAACSPTATTGDRPPVIVAGTTERVGDAIATLQAYGVSQLPVSERVEATSRRAGRLDQREGVCSTARIGIRRSSTDGGRADGPAAPVGGGRPPRWTRRSRC